MPFETVFFDLDGTLIDSKEGISRSVIYALEKLSCPIPSDAVLQKFIGPPLTYSYQTYCGLSEEDAWKGLEFYRDRFSVTGLFENRVYDGIEEMLRALTRVGKRLIVATSKPEEYSIRILEKNGLSRYFSGIVGSGLDESRSHKDEVIAYALDSCNITDKPSVVMVGDREYDILGARANGLYSVGVLYGFGDRKELTGAGADIIVDTVDALSKFLLP